MRVFISLLTNYGMKIITINLPDDYLLAIQEMVDLGLFQSRSDFVRKAIKDFLDNEGNFNSNIKPNEMFELFKNLTKIDIVGKTE